MTLHAPKEEVLPNPQPKSLDADGLHANEDQASLQDEDDHEDYNRTRHQDI